MPGGILDTVAVGGIAAKFWKATQASAGEDSDHTGREPSSSSATISGLQSKGYSILAWKGPETGVCFHLQSQESQEAMVRIAESI